MKIQLSKPYVDGDRTLTEIDLDLDGLKGRDLNAATRDLLVSKEVVLSPNTDPRYHTRIAAKAAHLPLELIEDLPAKDFTRITMEVQGFLLGADSEDSKTPES